MCGRPRPALVPAGRLEEWCGLLFSSTDAGSGARVESADRDGAGSGKVGVNDLDRQDEEDEEDARGPG